MDIGALRTLMLSANFAAFSVPAIVTRPYPDDTPIETTGIWMTTETQDAGFPGETLRREARRVMALRRSVVPTVPKKTYIEAALVGETDVKRWRVETTLTIEDQHVRVLVVYDPVIPTP